MRIFIAAGIAVDGTKDDSHRLGMLRGSMLAKIQDGLNRGAGSVRIRGWWFARWRRLLAELGGQIPDQAVWDFVDREQRFFEERTTMCVHCWFSHGDYPDDLDMQRGVPGLVLPGWRQYPSPALVRINKMRQRLRYSMPPLPPEPPAPEWKSNWIFFAPGITIREPDEQGMSEFRCEMLREFRFCITYGQSLKEATGF